MSKLLSKSTAGRGDELMTNKKNVKKISNSAFKTKPQIKRVAKKKREALALFWM